jgi:hypothetical protein
MGMKMNKASTRCANEEVEWERPTSEVVHFEGVKNPSTRLIQVRPEEMIVAIQAVDEHA